MLCERKKGLQGIGVKQSISVEKRKKNPLLSLFVWKMALMGQIECLFVLEKYSYKKKVYFCKLKIE